MTKDNDSVPPAVRLVDCVGCGRCVEYPSGVRCRVYLRFAKASPVHLYACLDCFPVDEISDDDLAASLKMVPEELARKIEQGDDE